tara:strand:- start:53 stop:478 length:426 start_codon:yes stop_codon:yes gene_type:complete
MAYFTKEKIEKCRKIFDQIDTNNSGGIDMEEMLVAIRKYSKYIEMDEIIDVFHKCDLDGNGEIDFFEYMNVMSQFKINDNEDDALLSFESLGGSVNNSIHIEKIKEYLDLFEITFDLNEVSKYIKDEQVDFLTFKKFFFDI